MTVLITGAAGFIGMHLTRALLARGESVLGLDNLNDYYDVALKQARLAELGRVGGTAFRFIKADIAERAELTALLARETAVDRIVHLAAQAGVRYSLTHPEAYIRANIEGQFAIVEACRAQAARIRHLVYASSSSVYGGNDKLPFSVADKIDKPISLYAVSKATAELMSYSYAHLYGIAQTGLRFFTAYGPWGRPDMSAFIFAKAILEGRPIPVFNHGDMRRDYTYIDDIVAGVIAALDRPPSAAGGAPHRVYNLGNSRSEKLMEFIGLIEAELGRKATIRFEGMQPGDVKDTFADIEASRRDLGYEPRTTIHEGVPRFIDWFKRYHGA